MTKLLSKGTKTKTFNIMFLLELSLYYPDDVNSAYDKLEVEDVDKQMNAYVQDTSFDAYNYTDTKRYYYFVKVYDKSEAFKKSIKTITSKCPFYVTHYKAGNTDSDYSIIVTKVIVNNRFKTLINSDYRSLFEEKELEQVLQNNKVLKRYKYIPNSFPIDHPSFQSTLNNLNIVIHSMARSTQMIDAMSTFFGVPKNLIEKNDRFFDSFKIEDEIIDSALIA